MIDQTKRASEPQTVTLQGRRYVILPEAEYRRLTGEPALPEPDERGYYPAAATARAILARQIIRRRRAAGLTQMELAKRAGVRSETLNRIEQTHRAPSPQTVEKIERALSEAEGQDRAEEEEAETRGRRRKR